MILPAPVHRTTCSSYLTYLYLYVKMRRTKNWEKRKNYKKNILQGPIIILGDAGFEHRTSDPQKSGALPLSHHISNGTKFCIPTLIQYFFRSAPGHWNHISSCSDTRIHIFFVFSLKRLCFELSIFNILKVPASFKKVFKNSSSQLHLALFKMYFRCYILLLKSMLFPLLS